jgi:hypothetical protein
MQKDFLVITELINRNKDEGDCLLGCCIMTALMMEAGSTFETSVTFYQIIRCYNP